tara:strand:+ start:1059 stop:1310 length:252 start_codon:yes stop_codon:yes gene_type:complete
MAIVLHARRGQAAPSLADFLSRLIAMDMMMNFPLIAIVELIAISGTSGMPAHTRQPGDFIQCKGDLLDCHCPFFAQLWRTYSA